MNLFYAIVMHPMMLLVFLSLAVYGLYHLASLFLNNIEARGYREGRSERVKELFRPITYEESKKHVR